MLVSFSARGPLRHHWYAVARADEVRDGPLGVELLKERLVLWRGPSGAVIAAPDKCTHRWAELHLGSVEDGCLVCPSHGWTFGDGGRCVRVRLRNEIPDDAHLTTFACDERHGLVWVCLGTPETRIPAAPVKGGADAPPTVLTTSTWRAPAARIVEALLGHDGTDVVGFDIPFTVRGSTRRGDVCAEHLVTCAPIDAMTSMVSTLVWSDAHHPELVHHDTVRESVERITGMFELTEQGKERDALHQVAAWRRALLSTISVQ